MRPLALVSATVAQDVPAQMAELLGWEVAQVPSVRAAVDALDPSDREDVVALLVEAETVGPELLDLLPGLEVLAGLRGNPVNVDISAATRRSLPVIYAPGRNAEAVADFTLGLLLAMVRNVAIAHHAVLGGALTVGDGDQTRRHRDVIWASPDLPFLPYEHYAGPELSSLEFLLIGFGDIGRVVAERIGPLVRALRVVDPAVPAEEVRAAGWETVSLQAGLAHADIVSLHARSAKPIIGEAELTSMKPGSYLINTARATVLDYDALAAALTSGHLRGAALDVFPEEPLRASSPLLRAPGLTMTPHLAGASTGVTDQHSRILLEGLAGLYGGKQWHRLPLCNPEVEAGWRQGAQVDAGAVLEEERS